jgi:glycosyltransferase involved in cell wall biosynthesis
MPTFSVVIPTRNRAQLLAACVSSVLAQSTDDFEIVVSDNFSGDNTEAVARGFKDPRVRYVRTRESLRFNESWEFAASQARGDYLMWLGDEDALLPHSLSKLSRSIAEHRPGLLCYPGARYYPDEAPLANGARNLVKVPRFTRSVVPVDSDRELTRRFLFDYNGCKPQIWNACYRRDVVESIVRQSGRFCLPPSAEHSGPIMCLGLLDFFVHIDEPLYIAGFVTPSLTVMDVYNGRKVVEPMDEARHVPFSKAYIFNLKAEAMLRAQAAMGGKLRYYEPHWENYFFMYYDCLLGYGRQGFPVTEDIDAFWRTLDGVPRSLRDRVKQRVAAAFHAPPPSRLHGGLLRVIRWAERLERHRTLERSDLHVFSVADAGFSSSAECAAWLEQRLAGVRPGRFAFHALASRVS